MVRRSGPKPEPATSKQKLLRLCECVVEWFYGTFYSFVKEEAKGVKQGWIMFSVIAVAFVLTVLFAEHYFFPCRAGDDQTKQQQHKKEVVEQLSKLLLEGERLEGQLANPSLEIMPNDRIQAWVQDLDSFLIRDLGISYSIRSKSPNGIMPQAPVGLGPGQQKDVWWGVYVRCVRINEFLHELSRQP